MKNLYQYRELLKTNIKKEIRGKYKGAWLGVLWSFLNPLLMLAVYAIIFPLILKNDIPHYTMFLFTAMMPWNFFTSTINGCSYSIIASGNIIKKVYFPREILPISIVLSNTVNFLITCIIMVVFLLLSGVGITPYILLFPIILLIQEVLLLVISFILSAITVYARDVEHIVNVGLMALFYGTPIVYSLSMIPMEFRKFIFLNPMTSIIEGYRSILFYHTWPNFLHLGIVLGVSMIIFVIGLFIFKKLEKGFAEEL